jgi:hypothetical protein
MDRSSDTGSARVPSHSHESTGTPLTTKPCPSCDEPLAARAESGGSVVCPACGAALHFKSVAAGVNLEGHSLRRARHPSWAKFDTQRVEGDSFYRKTGRWHHMKWIIDRPRNWYYKHIADRETGEIIRHEDGPLSEHRGGVPRTKSPKHARRPRKEAEERAAQQRSS